jgi:hypothetical protein
MIIACTRDRIAQEVRMLHRRCKYPAGRKYRSAVRRLAALSWFTDELDGPDFDELTPSALAGVGEEIEKLRAKVWGE